MTRPPNPFGSQSEPRAHSATAPNPPVVARAPVQGAKAKPAERAPGV